MRLKRLVASVSAGFEDFVAKVENHEAVADCLIDDVRQATARVRVQHARVQSQTQRLARRIEELTTDETRWNERALSLASSDEEKALECVRRAKRAAEQRSATRSQLDDHQRLAHDLKGRLDDLEQRLNELQLKRTSLSARTARARTVRRSRCEGGEAVEAVFDRWETSVLADEYLDDVLPDAIDPLERELREDEDRSDLEARLAALVTERGGER